MIHSRGGSDTQAQIDTCLRCPRKTCTGNCMRLLPGKKPNRRSMTVKGVRVTQAEIAAMCHIGHGTVQRCVKMGWTGDQIVEYYGGRK